MKKLFKVASVAIGMLLIGNFAKAQAKIGYINFQALVGQMPEAKTVKSQIDIYSKTFIDQLTVMNNELQTRGQAYQTQSATMTDAKRSATQNELQDLQKRIQDFNNTAQQQVEAKSNELSKPLIDKARTAVSSVAKEKGYTYVFDSSQITLIVSPEGDDLGVAAKTKLGIK